jgi:hypothetical protein
LTLPVAAALLAMLALAPTAGGAGQFYGVVPQGQLAGSDYSRMSGGGVGTLRFTADWGTVQTSPGEYQWGGLDAIIGNAAARGIRVLPSVYRSRGGEGKPPIRRSQLRSFREFMAAMAGRYAPGGAFWQPGGQYQSMFPGAEPRPVLTWQLWTEQNGFAYWDRRPDFRAYGKLVKKGAAGVRSRHRQAEIVLGGMFGTPSGRGSMTSWGYLRKLYGVKGIKAAFDTVAIHPYSPSLRGLRYQIRRVVDVIRDRRDRGTELRLTEIGWGSKGRGHDLNKGPRGQARMLKQSFRIIKSNRRRWNISGANWFSFQDGNAGCGFCRSSGLFRGPPGNRHAKPAWRAFKRAAT